jgi:hypothetical protein
MFRRRGTDSFRDSRARAETHLAASFLAAESSGRTTAGLSQDALTASNSSASDFRKAANRSATRHSTSCAGRRVGLGDDRQNRVALTAKHSADDVCHAYKRRSHWLCPLRYLRPGASEPGAPGFRPSIHRHRSDRAKAASHLGVDSGQGLARLTFFRQKNRCVTAFF